MNKYRMGELKGVDLKDAIKMLPNPLCFWDGI